MRFVGTVMERNPAVKQQNKASNWSGYQEPRPQQRNTDSDEYIDFEEV